MHARWGPGAMTLALLRLLSVTRRRRARACAAAARAEPFPSDRSCSSVFQWRETSSSFGASSALPRSKILPRWQICRVASAAAAQSLWVVLAEGANPSSQLTSSRTTKSSGPHPLFLLYAISYGSSRVLTCHFLISCVAGISTPRCSGSPWVEKSTHPRSSQRWNS